MMNNYNIPMTIYDKLMFSICEEYDVKFKRLASIVKNITKNKYELPTTVENKVTLRMGGVNVYIWKAPQDLFDIEYMVEFRVNTKQFVDFVNEFMNKNGFKAFDLNKYMYKDELLTNLSNYIVIKYNLNTTIYQSGGYIEFDTKVFMHPSIKIIDI